jgi:hypothetical protein
MGRKFDEIARRKELLIERCAREREELADCFRQICLPLHLGAFLLMVGKALRAYPAAAAGLSSLLVTGFGAKLMRAAGKLIGVVRVIRPLWSWWSKRRPRA